MFGVCDHEDSWTSNLASSWLYVKEQSLCRHKLTSAHHIILVPDVFMENVMGRALRNLKISQYSLYGLCCTNYVVLTVSEWGLCFLPLATLSTLPSDASNASNYRQTLWTNDWVTLKNCNISRSLCFMCTATITTCLFISWVSLLSSIYYMRSSTHMWVSSNTWHNLYIFYLFSKPQPPPVTAESARIVPRNELQ